MDIRHTTFAGAMRATTAGVVAVTLVGMARGAEVEVANCLVVPNKDVEVSARIEGEIRSVAVKEGDAVEAGQRLAQLVDDQARIEEKVRALDAADDSKIKIGKLQVDVLKYKLESDRRLAKTKSVSELELLQSEARLRIGELQVKQGESELQRAKLIHQLTAKKLDDYRVVAPISGVVARQLKESGEAVKPREPVFRIVDVRVVLVEGYLPVAHLRRVAIGQRVSVRLGIDPDRAYAGKVVFKDVQVESASDTFRVKAEVANPELTILAGLRATMRITLGPVAETGKGKPKRK